MRKINLLAILISAILISGLFSIRPVYVQAGAPNQCPGSNYICLQHSIVVNGVKTNTDYSVCSCEGKFTKCNAGTYACNSEYTNCCAIGTNINSSETAPKEKRATPAPTATPVPVPSCTVSLSPNPASIPEGSTLVYTASVVPADGTVDQVNFTSSNTSVASLSPASDTTSAYNSTATGKNAGSSTIRAGVIMSGAERCSKTATLTVTPASPWWQAKNADIVTLGDLISQIPSSLSTYFIQNGGGGFPGVAIYGGTIADFSAGSGAGTVSSAGWLGNATTVSQKTFNYDYFAGLIPGDVIFNEITSTSVDGATFESGGTLSRGYYWYRFDGTTGSMINQDLTITSAVNLGSRKVILLVKGANLNIGGNINLTDGEGFFVAITGQNESAGKGNIIIDPAVTSLEGVYFADSTFQTGSAGVDADDQLYVRGAVAAYGGMVLERDLPNDNTTPAEFFEYGLDQVLLYPSSLSVRKIRWKEVAP